MSHFHKQTVYTQVIVNKLIFTVIDLAFYKECDHQVQPLGRVFKWNNLNKFKCFGALGVLLDGGGGGDIESWIDQHIRISLFVKEPLKMQNSNGFCKL